jgi:hypothetical protein
LACDKAKQHAYPHELWTTRLLARHARERGPAAGHQCLARLAQGTVAKQPVVVHYMEHCPPDVGAAFIWLKNRDPEHWRDVQNVEHVMGKYIISDRPMTAEQWAAERATVIDDVVEEMNNDLPGLSPPGQKP